MLVLLISVLVFVLSLVLTNVTRHQSLKRQLLDIPNERSSHKQPTPRGGGIGIVVGFSVGLVLLGLAGLAEPGVVLGIGGAGLITAFVGLMDDLNDLKPQRRLAAHIAAATWLLVFVGGMPPLDLGFARLEWGVIGHVIGLIGAVWLLNLYNFMDGIDGIAAGEAVYVALAAIPFLLAWQIPTVASISVVLALACLGFLYWNWPPAKIFMGDVGSGFLGIVFAGLAFASGQQQPLALWLWLILLGVFVVDATTTLLKRIANGERWYTPHRTHMYQLLAQHWQGHKRVTISVLLLNVFWLLPCAALVYALPSRSLFTALLSLLGLVVLSSYLRSRVLTTTPDEQ
jgi:Fuc2NAc and GlcNAc transferase